MEYAIWHIPTGNAISLWFDNREEALDELYKIRGFNPTEASDYQIMNSELEFMKI